jgi:hypothetical protein
MNAEASQVATNGASPKPTAVFETVDMEDGRKVAFAGAAEAPKRRKLLKEIVFGEDGAVGVRLDFRNGRTLTSWIPSVTVSGTETQIKDYAAGHGWSQKLGDETAGETEIDDMVLAVEELDERLQKGEWAQAREGGGMAGTSILLKALVELKSKQTGEAPEVVLPKMKEWLKGKKQDEKLAMRNHASIKPIVDRLEAEKASKGKPIDTNSLLEEALA